MERAFTGQGLAARLPASAGTTPGQPESASPAPSTSGVDLCAVGRWSSTSSQHSLTLGGDTVVLSGGAGAILTYDPAGTMTLDYNPSQEEEVTVDGIRWTYVVRGTVAANVYHDDGLEYLTSVRAAGTITLYKAGRPNNSVPLSVLLVPVKYVCSGDTMRFLSGENPTEWARVR
jgi:hypothetical protein